MRQSRCFDYVLSSVLPVRYTELICRLADPGGRAVSRRVSAAARWLGLRARIPPAAWMSVVNFVCVLPGRSICDGPITHPEVP